MEGSVHKLDSDCTITMAKTGLNDLPHDLFFLVVTNLLDVFDFVRVRATCKSWRPLISLSDSPRLPWIFNRRLISFGAKLEFYSLASGEFHTIHVPKASDKFLAGPSHGYLLAFDTRCFTLSLLNPFTCNEIPLPPLELRWSSLSSYFRPELICTGEVVAISGFTSQKFLVLASCRLGENKWMAVERQVRTNLVGRSYYKGMFFINESEMGATTAIDPTAGVAVFSVLAPVRQHSNLEGSQELRGFDYLVESSGELLRVFRLWDDYKTLETAYFEIYRLDCADGEPRWVNMDGIGDRMLFLDSVHGLSLMNTGVQGLKRNSIYFIKLFNEGNGWSKFLCRYDIIETTTEVLPFDVQKLGDGPWIVPSLQ
ncbi:hypothetical protein LUZ61_010684 [Rhynchospora tenuis]|uniref:KIB1-4 beta-propeller domain-containing protein n=1 Tax=Rhynchospora tenuis TaxID=198213 RepID=A0AAD5ZZX8_9POAL|nr:hypothetical protein LUZ61_010684 [Rhynchospora tenuis]